MSPYRNLLLSLGLSILPVTLASQTPTPPFAEIGMAHLDSLLHFDPTVRDHTQAKDALELFAVAPPDALGRLSDTQLLAFTDLFLRSLAQARVQTCAQVWREGLAKGFVTLAMEMDSSLAREWAVVLEQMVRTGLTAAPLGRRVSPAEARTALLSGAGTWTAEQRATAQSLVEGRPQSDTATCDFVRRSYARVARLPGPQGPAVLRTLMFGSPAERRS